MNFARTFSCTAVIAIVVLTSSGVTSAGMLANPGNFFEYAECAADGNDAHTSATVANYKAGISGSVCEDDPFDWYLIPLQGELTWTGIIAISTDRPGLAVRLYLDTGGGPQQIKEDSPVANPNREYFYGIGWNLGHIAKDAGYSELPPGNYYIRVTYYSAHPGDHPYELSFQFKPKVSTGTGNGCKDMASAKSLPPGMMYYGHLFEDQEQYFYFDVTPGQITSGLIFGEVLMPWNPVLGMDDMKISLLSGSGWPLAVKIVTVREMNYIDLAYDSTLSMKPLANGRYYIVVNLNVTNLPNPDTSGKECYFRIFNQAMAPSNSQWARDTGGETSMSGVMLGNNMTMSGNLYWPRNTVNYYRFTTDCYFLGDVVIKPWTDIYGLAPALTDALGNTLYTGRMSGLGLTCRATPMNPGTHYVKVEDTGCLLAPIAYNIRIDTHGMPMTESIGHDTWQTALEIVPLDIDEQGFIRDSTDVRMDFQPAIQDKFFVKLDVASGGVLAGWFDIFGSRKEYSVYLGQIGPGGNPVWSPAISPNKTGKVYLDMSFDYFTGPGTYYIKIEPQPTAGRMRAFLENHSVLAECIDEGGTYQDAQLLGGNWDTDLNSTGHLCPPVDMVDWFYFVPQDTGAMAAKYHHIYFKAATMGMRFKLYDEHLNFIDAAVISEDGGEGRFDTDGLTEKQRYYVKVEPNETRDIIQVYYIRLRSDILDSPYKMEIQYMPEFDWSQMFIESK